MSIKQLKQMVKAREKNEQKYKEEIAEKDLSCNCIRLVMK